MNIGELLDFLQRKAEEAACWERYEEALMLRAAADLMQEMYEDIDRIAHLRIEECELCVHYDADGEACLDNECDCEHCKESACRCHACRDMDKFEYKGTCDGGREGREYGK